MELAHSHLTNRNDIDFDVFNRTRRDLEKNEFCSAKINGSCCVIDGFKSLYPFTANILNKDCAKDDLDFALTYGYANLKNKYRQYDCHVNINFAWYRDRELLGKIVETYNETEVLVVIGYSFPFFNRDVDREIIRSMSKLRKIYIQDCNPENIKSRFLSILPDWEKNNVQIIPVNDVTEFFLPPEL